MLFKDHNGNIIVNKKKKVSRTVVLFTSVFIISWFPIHFLSIWYRADNSFPKNSVTFTLKLVAHTMTYANSTINPIIYAFYNDSFKVIFSNLFPFFVKQNERNNIHLNNRIVITRTKSNIPESEGLFS